jgi:hypothetical protein
MKLLIKWNISSTLKLVKYKRRHAISFHIYFHRIWAYTNVWKHTKINHKTQNKEKKELKKTFSLFVL